MVTFNILNSCVLSSRGALDTNVLPQLPVLLRLFHVLHRLLAISGWHPFSPLYFPLGDATPWVRLSSSPRVSVTVLLRVFVIPYYVDVMPRSWN